MKLALTAGPFTSTHADAVAEAERLGFDSIWTAETYGHDCFTPMGWWAAKTQTIGLGTSVAIIDARTPAATAMAAMTLDEMSGGRYRVGLGVSGPQVVEGWFGQPFSKPLGKTREYVDILHAIFQREAPVAYDGEHYHLPARGGMGLGKPLKTSLHPRRPDIPIYLAAEGPRNVSLAGEIADGWTAFYVSPHSDAFYRGCLEEGFQRRAGGRPDDFDVVCMIQIVVGDDVEAAADWIRPHIAFMVGGMGAPGANFHYDALARVGFEGTCEEVARLWREGDRKAAASVVTTEMVEALTLVGPIEKLKEDIAPWRTTCITTLMPMMMGAEVTPEVVAQMADLVWG